MQMCNSTQLDPLGRSSLNQNQKHSNQNDGSDLPPSTADWQTPEGEVN